MKKNGVYFIKDEFFNRYKDKHFSLNKGEHRPFYYALQDNKNQNIFWIIPLTTQIEKAKAMIDKKYNGNEKKCPFYVLGGKIINEKETVFNVGSVFPISEKYIKEPLLIDNKPFILKNDKLIKELEEKTMLNIRKNNPLKSVNKTKIRNELIKELEEKTLNLAPYNPIKGVYFSKENTEILKKQNFKSDKWLSKKEIETKNIKIKENENPVILKLYFKKNEDILEKSIVFYNIEQLSINNQIEKVFKIPNELKKKEKIEIIKNKDYEYER